MSKSILHDKTAGTCYLCIKLHGDYSWKRTQEHHVIFGWANRKLSEKYGLKVYLCDAHHEHGKEAVHVNADIANDLKAEAQRAFQRKNLNLSFREIFGKNYIDDGDRQEAEKELTEEQIQLAERIRRRKSNE